MKKQYLSKDEVDALLDKAKAGDNDAWEALYKNFEAYIYKRAKDLLLTFSDNNNTEIKNDLFQAGWLGFVDAMKNYKVGNNKFLTYATAYIDGEMKKQRDFYLNPLGLSERPKEYLNSVESIDAAKESADDSLSLEISKVLASKGCDINVDALPTDSKYPAEGRVLQILEILRLLTDENHTLSKEEIKRLLRLYRAAKYGLVYKYDADNTITSTLEQIIAELDPLEYTKENESEYTILYEGYKENRYKENKSCNNKKAQPITGFSYNHIFSDRELDTLIAQICFSDIISSEDKTRIVKKLISTASVHYKSQFFDGKKLKFNPKAVHSRFTSKNSEDRVDVISNIAILQNALNNLAQIRFRFNRYNEEGVLVPTSDYVHELSPYHLVMYRDNYYCIGLKKDDKRIWHYRVDLMSDIEIVRDDEGKMIHIELGSFDGLPISNTNWDPEKYMSEHLNMAYDEPRDIYIKIRNTDYTILHDWFGNHYEKTDQKAEEGFHIVKVKTSPSMVVYLAMQYFDRIEIMDPEIREKIREAAIRIGERY